MNDTVMNKIQSVQRCVRRAREEYQLSGDDFANDLTRQDAALLNVMRACETTIDLANYVHQYTMLDIRIVEAIITSELDELLV